MFGYTEKRPCLSYDEEFERKIGALESNPNAKRSTKEYPWQLKHILTLLMDPSGYLEESCEQLINLLESVLLGYNQADEYSGLQNIFKVICP